ncbi:MAG: UDP-N-acetylmuramoyl-L-alanyl-D-glutamate--2,6-diaminopimelate ligase [Planctomycetota bacterium]
MIQRTDVAPEASVSPGRVRITDITDDSRTVLPGALFIARPGVRTDGARYITEAVANGAAAVLVPDAALASEVGAHVAVLTAPDVALAGAILAERFFGNPSSALGVMAVTGTNGKTTVAHAVWRLCNAARLRCGLVGTVFTDDGSTRAPSVLTTPPATELSFTLSAMVEAGCRAAAIEASSHALDQGRVAAIDTDVAVFTNLTGDHLDYHHTMDAYASAKARLFEPLRAGALAIVNVDDPAHECMLRDCRAEVLRCSLIDPSLDAFARITSTNIDGMHTAFAGPWGEFEVTLPVIGAYNAMNALQAIAAAHRLGVPGDRLRDAASLIEPPPGRLEPVPGPATTSDDHPRVFVDFAHTDAALRHALAAARTIVPEGCRLIVVFGCGGDRDATKRPRMARGAADLADVVVITSDNPRTEEPHRIITDILAGLSASERDAAIVHADRSRAIAEAVALAGPHDVVVIAGKGHEREQILPDGAGGVRRIPFDDAHHAVEALAARRPSNLQPAGPR